MNNSNSNATDLPVLVQRISKEASGEGLHMRSLGECARELKPRKGKTLTQSIVLNFAERLGNLADCLVLQTDPAGNPRTVYVVAAETPENTCLILSDEEYEQVLKVFTGTPIPLSWMRLVLDEDGSFGNVTLKTLNPPVADEDAHAE